MLHYAQSVTSHSSALVAPPEDCQDFYRQYLADISHLAPLEADQDNILMQQLELVKCGVLPPEEGERIVQRLITGSLRLVVHLAVRYYQYQQAMSGGKNQVALLDLIQAGNATLVECAHRCLTTKTHPDFSAYAGSCIRYALKDCYRQASAVSFSSGDWIKAGKDGTRFHVCDALSLDQVPDGEDDRPLIERLQASPPLPENTAAQEQAETILCRLPKREQRIIRLRYGLDPEDQRPHSYQAIANKIGGCCPATCQNQERLALRALREEVPLKTSPEYYSASQAYQVLGISHTAFQEWVHKGIIQRYHLFSTDEIGVYSKAEIDALAQEYERIAHEYYTLSETLVRLGVSERALHNWVRDGKLTRYQAPGRENYGGIYSKAQVDQLVSERSEAAHLYYTREEAATRLGISASSVNRWVSEGRLSVCTHPGYHRGCYAREEVDQLVHEQETLSRDYYTTEQAAARIGFSPSGFQSWALRVGVRPARRTLDGVQDLYSKSEIDPLLEHEKQVRDTCYTKVEVLKLLGISSSTLINWGSTGKLTRIQLPGRENYGALYPKSEVENIARQREKVGGVYA